jgi:TRAP-type C4-dicarboxylate transport system substrate-binding protein
MDEMARRSRTLLRRREALGLVSGGLGLVAVAPAGVAAESSLRLVGSADTQHGSVEAMERLRRSLEETFRGRVAVQIDREGVPDDRAALEQVRGGKALMAWVRVAELTDLAPEITALSAPFLFLDQSKVMGLLERTAIGPLLNDQLRKHNLEPIAYFDGGALRLAGSTLPPLAEFRGRQVTARPGTLRQVALEALGLRFQAGVPQPQQAGDGLMELRTDDLLGIAAQGPQLALAEKPHAHDLMVVVANRDLFDGQPLDIRETLRAKTSEVSSWQLGASDQVDAVALGTLRQRGVTITPMPDAERKEAHVRVKEAVSRVLQHADRNILDTVLAYAD